MIFLFAEIPWKSKTDPCEPPSDRKSTRLNSSHDQISYAVFCLKKKKIRYDSVIDCRIHVRMCVVGEIQSFVNVYSDVSAVVCVVLEGEVVSVACVFRLGCWLGI